MSITINMEMLMIMVVIVGSVMLISDIILFIYNIRNSMNKKTLGALDIIVSTAFLIAWNNFFRDSVLISSEVFWIVFVGLFLTMLIGIANFALALIINDGRY